MIKAEYEKLEPFINLYSNPIAKTEADPLLRDLEQLARLPFAREALTKLVENTKEVVAQQLDLQEMNRPRKRAHVGDT